MKHITKLLAVTMTMIVSTSIYAVPSVVDSPVDDAESWWHANGKDWSWTKSHAGNNAGIGGADDYYALDLNWGHDDDDRGKPVYAVESGYIYTGNGWGGKSYGQLLINHTTNGDSWSSGYLHMSNITKRSGWVEKGELIGRVSDVHASSPHLHFVIYNSHAKRGLQSVHPSNGFNKNIDYPLRRQK